MGAARQLPLFIERAHEDAFRRWSEDNPHVWQLFVRFTLDVARAGHRNYSADAICHRIRWHMDVETKDPGGFKINNNYTAFLARRFEAEHPEFAGFFRMREQRVTAAVHTAVSRPLVKG